MAYNLGTSQRVFQKIQELNGMEAKELLAALATNEAASASSDYRSVRDAVEDAMATLETRQTFDARDALDSLIHDDGIDTTTTATPSTPLKSREIKWCVFCKKSYCEVTMIPGDCKYHPGLEKHLVHERYIRWSCCGRQFGEEGCKSRNHTDNARNQ